MFSSASSSSTRFQNQFWLLSLLGVAGSLVAGALISLLGVIGAAVVIILPVAGLVLAGVLSEPRIGLLCYLQLSFLLNVFARFLPISAPFGTLIDVVLVLTLISCFINGQRMNWRRLRHPVFFVLLFWTFFTILQYFNPEAPYRPAWFFHFRTFSMYWILAATALLVVPIKKSDIQVLIKTWLVWSFLAALWSFKQQYIGLTANEMAWLNAGADRTHILFGHLRSFSFYTDASQFGAEMAGVALMCLIWVFDSKKIVNRAVYLLLAGVYFWGYAVSGTRSALFVLVAGFGFYLILKRDFIKILAGLCLAIPIYLLLMYTDVGSSNYQVQRIRSALRPMEDPSFLLRLHNKEKLARRLEDLPFGAGLGTSESVGQRFSPEHWASQIAPDSWYVILWIETGRVGMVIYIAMVVFIVLLATLQIWKLKDPDLLVMMTALLAEFVGIVVMAYSNPVVGQFPTSSIIFINSIILTTCTRWDTKVEKPEVATEAVLA
ncbi:O-antigen ligase domain-containing protein [Larkinella sp.]|uniref:O-antigen ligase domain-containing protein n=1 Tax=Larkinella sp. TaxID=2034517 RepID=UPI003BAC7136